MSPTSAISALPLPGRLHDWRLRHANVEFALLGMLATALALYAGILLELKAPYTAAVTVWVVANTRPGHVLSKSVYRVLGTLLGACFAVVTVACFDSMPVLLFIALAVWVGICTAVGNLLRHFRGYFGLLAGYTAAFIVLGSSAHPDRVVDYALDRTSAIVIGVLSMSLVVSLLGVRRSPGEVMTALKRIHGQCLEAITGRWGKAPDEIAASRLALSAEYAKTEALLEYANLESPGFHLRVRRLRALTGLLLDVVDASRLSAAQLEKAHAGLRTQVIGIYTDIAQALKPVTQEQNHAGLETSRDRMEDVAQDLRGRVSKTDDRRQLELLCPILDLLERWLPLLESGALGSVPMKDPFLGEIPVALRQGVRAMVAILVSAAFWMLTGWQSGAAFLINGAAFCALASTMSQPVKGVSMFAVATAVSGIAGFFCKFYLLPQAEGFVPMIACLAVVLVPVGCLAFSKNPMLDGIGMTTGLFLLALVQPSNHMTYDPAQYLSSALAGVFSGLILIPVYALVLPVAPGRQAEAVLRGFRRRVQRLAKSRKTSSQHTWRLLAHHQIQRLQGNSQTTDAELAEGLRLLQTGSCLVRLRILSASCDLLDPGRIDAERWEIETSAELGPQQRATLSAHLESLSALVSIPTPL